MKIAIHKGIEFALGWEDYCKTNSIPYKLVNAFDNDIMEQLSDCDGFMWQHIQGTKDELLAKQLLYSLEEKGLRVFPNFRTTWHFDDKVGQKYLLEAIGAPLVPTYVFYTKKDALSWINATTFPKVFKLRGGAGASNVSLVRTKSEAIRLINKAFGRGIVQNSRLNALKERWRQYRSGLKSFVHVLKGIGRLFILTESAKLLNPEKGYVYFQEFIPNNNCDVRLIVIDGKYAYGMKRVVRDGDFRASGSGSFVYEDLDKETIRIAFNVAKRLKLQSVAFDFVYNEDKQPLIIEMSYGYGTKGSSMCQGYWDEDLIWHEEKPNPFGWMVEALMRDINEKS